MTIAKSKHEIISAVELRKAYIRGLEGIKDGIEGWNRSSNGLKLDEDDFYIISKWLRENLPFHGFCDEDKTIEDVATPIANFVSNLDILPEYGTWGSAEKDLGVARRQTLKRFFYRYASALGACDTRRQTDDYTLDLEYASDRIRRDRAFNDVYIEALELARAS